MTEREIFLAALKQPTAGERAAFLDQACVSDVNLRGQIEALLAEHAQLGSYLEAPVAVAQRTVDDPPATESPGMVIGPYKLLQQIGEGGMGTVYMAEQSQPVQRKVALKVIKPGMDSRQVIARFEAERQALAMMDHVNIARVFDGGATENGRPYFVMELVHGVPITKYCDDNHLTPRERLELFVPVCQAIQHAHQKGIIHRDIKPSNVMVTLYDGKPVPKVIDFGVAKATEQKLTERTLFTQYGTMVGTFEYMSPEQAEMSALGVDTRSDIYSLGVLLYELLTGSTPLTQKRMKEAAYAEILRMIKEEEPPRPSTRLSDSGEALASIAAQRKTEPATLTKLVRGELDWIVMKTLEKDRNRRYETANGLAHDIENYLQDEPVQACPPSATYRLRKFGRRNKAALVMLATVVVALLAGTIVSTWQAFRATEAEDLAQKRLEAKNEALARAQADAARANAISALLRETLQAANPESVRGKDYTVRQLLDDLSRGLGERLKDQPEAEADVHATIGNAYRTLGLTQNAQPHLDKALEIRRRVLAPNDAAVAQSYLDRAMNFFEIGNLNAAEAETREALAIFQKGNAKDEQVLGALEQLAFILSQQRNFAQQEQIAEQAFAFARDKGLSDRPIIASMLHSLAGSRIATGNPAEAEALLLKAVALHRGPLQTAWALNILGASRVRLKKLDEAEANVREALTIFRKHYDENHKSIVLTSGLLQQILTIKGDQAGLDAFRVDRVARLSKALELQPANLGLRIHFGNLLRDGKDFEGAYAQFSEVIAKDPKFVDGWMGRGDCEMWRSNFAKAVEEFSMAIKLNPKYAHAWTSRAWAHFNLRRWDDGVSDYSKAIELAPQVHTNWFHRGHAHLQLKEWDKAAADFGKVVEGWPGQPGGWHLRALAFANMNQPDKAIADLRQAVAKGFDNAEHLRNDSRLAPLRSHDDFKKLLDELAEKAIAALRKAALADPKSAKAHTYLGAALRAQGKLKEAIISYRMAVDLDPKNAKAHATLGAALHAHGKLDEAINVFHKVIELDPKNSRVHTNLAWILATCSDAKLRDGAQAVEHAKIAVDLDPKVSNLWSNLGVAHYRAGQWKEARTALEKANQLVNGNDHFHRFFLAMAQWKLGNKEEARKSYDQAVQWMDKNAAQNEELRRFRAEAEELLGVKEKKEK